MKKTLLSSLAFVFSSIAVWAADLPARTHVETPILLSSYKWEGIYFGANGGYNWGRAEPSTTSVQAGVFATCPGCVTDIAGAGNHSFQTRGILGGLQVGYNFQNSHVLWGLETDLQYFRSSGSNSVSVYSATCPCDMTVSSSMNTKWLSTLRTRVGFVSDDVVFYATGGIAVTQLQASWRYVDNFGAQTNYESSSISKLKQGWVAGLGVQYRTDENWIVGAELLHVKFSGVSTSSNNFVDRGTPSPNTIFYHSNNLASKIIRTQLSRKF